MKDITREMSLNMQRGVRDAKEIKWGPISLMRIRYPQGTAWGMAIHGTRYAFNVSLSRAEEEL